MGNVEIKRAERLLEQAMDYGARGDYSRAEELTRQATSIMELEVGPEAPDMGNLLHIRGEFLEQMGRLDDAAECARGAIAVLDPLVATYKLDDLFKALLSHSLGLLGNCLRQMGRYDEAEKPLLRAIEISELLTDSPEELAGALNNFGVLCMSAGWLERGDEIYSRAVQVIRKHLSGETEPGATVLYNQGALAHAREDFVKAERSLRESWESRRASLGDDDPNTLTTAVAYAAVLDQLDRRDEARPIYEQVIAAYERIGQSDSYPVAACLHNLAVLERAERNLNRASEMCRRAVDIKERALGKDHPETAFSRMNLGAILIEMNQRNEAKAILTSALNIFTRTLEPEHPNLETCRGLLARASIELVP